MTRFIVPVHYSIGLNGGPSKKYCNKYGLSAIKLNENSENAKGRRDATDGPALHRFPFIAMSSSRLVPLVLLLLLLWLLALAV